MPNKRSHKSHKRAPGHVQKCHNLNRCSPKKAEDCHQDEHCLWLTGRGCQSKPGHREHNPFVNARPAPVASDNDSTSNFSTPPSTLSFRSKKVKKSVKKSSKKRSSKKRSSKKKSIKRSGKKRSSKKKSTKRSVKK